MSRDGAPETIGRTRAETYPVPAWPEITCPICGLIARRRGGYLSCAECGLIRDEDVVSRVVAQALGFERHFAGLLDHAPELEFARIGTVASHLLRRRVAPKLARDLVLAWAHVRFPRMPESSVALAIENAADAELRRGGR